MAFFQGSELRGQGGNTERGAGRGEPESPRLAPAGPTGGLGGQRLSGLCPSAGGGEHADSASVRRVNRRLVPITPWPARHC